MTTTTGITQDCLLTEARPRSSKGHLLARTICWVAFGVHAVSLGMACLAVQLVLVTLTLAFSIATVERWHSNETRIGNRLCIKQTVAGGAQIMAKAYALLDLNEEEEQNMLDWSLFPTRSNKLWLSAFQKYKEDARHDPSVLETWGERMR